MEERTPIKSDQDFDQTNFNTWRQDGINGVWAKYYQRGYDGLVVLCALLRTSLPIPKDDFDQHSHVNALKNDLIVHFGYFKRDRRIGNDPFFGGSNQRPNAIAGVLFMAYKLKHDTQASQKQPVKQKQAGQNKHAEEKQDEQNDPVEQKQAEQNEHVEENQPEQNEPVKEKQDEQNEPVEQKQAEQNEHVEEKQREQNEPVKEKQAE